MAPLRSSNTSAIGPRSLGFQALRPSSSLRAVSGKVGCALEGAAWRARDRAGRERERAGVGRGDAGDERVQQDLALVAAAVAPAHGDARRLRRAESEVVDATLDPVVGVRGRRRCRSHRRVAAHDVGEAALSGRAVERGERPHVFARCLAEADRLRSLARDVAGQAKLALQVGGGGRAEGEDDEGDERFDQADAALASAWRGRVAMRAGRHWKSFQLPLTRTKLPLPAASRASTAASRCRSTAPSPR